MELNTYQKRQAYDKSWELLRETVATGDLPVVARSGTGSPNSPQSISPEQLQRLAAATIEGCINLAEEFVVISVKRGIAPSGPPAPAKPAAKAKAAAKGAE